MKIYRVVDSFSFPVPPKLSEQEYYTRKNSIPFYPSLEGPLKMTLKKYWLFFVFFSIPPFWLFYIFFLGTIPSIINYYKAVKERNDIIKKYYDIIYNTSTYYEYLEKYKHI